MRTKIYKLLKRGRKWYLRYDIPADVRSFFPEIKSRTKEEALKTTDEKEARRLRNRRLGQFERSWNILSGPIREMWRRPTTKSNGNDL